MRQKLTVTLNNKSHSVFIVENELDLIGEYIKELFPELWKSFVITDSKVYKLYGEEVVNSLTRSGLNPGCAIVPGGEQYKSFQMASKLYDQLSEHGMDRKSVILALGGGMIGDLGGFVAASYMRGIPFIQVPTTLLAQADSSIGGKVAVNHSSGKNKIGFFYSPIMVFSDVSVLKSLSCREINSGMAEIIRHGMILDEKFFQWIENNFQEICSLDMDVMVELIYRSCEIKKRVVEVDHYDNNYRAILNFGHTIGHALETLTEYKRYQHGEAVAIGMVQICKLAEKMGLIQKKDVLRFTSLLKKFQLPVDLPRDCFSDSIISLIKLDKKSIHEQTTLVLPESIGHVQLVKEWKENELIQVLDENLRMYKEE